MLGCSILTTGFASAESPHWVQVHATIQYRREGSIVTAPEGKFTFTLEASIDEMMERVEPRHSSERPSYILNSDYARSFKLSGTTKLIGSVSQYDEPTKKTYHADAELTAALSKPDELRIEEISFNPNLGDGYSVKIPAKLKLTGSVHSDYPRMPDTSENDSILMWPSPIKYTSEEGFIAEGEMQFYSDLGKRPDDNLMGMMYDTITAADSLPGVGGLDLQCSAA